MDNIFHLFKIPCFYFKYFFTLKINWQQLRKHHGATGNEFWVLWSNRSLPPPHPLHKPSLPPCICFQHWTQLKGNHVFSTIWLKRLKNSIKQHERNNTSFSDTEVLKSVTHRPPVWDSPEGAYLKDGITPRRTDLGSWESAFLRSCPVYPQDAGGQGPLIYHKLPCVCTQLLAPTHRVGSHVLLQLWQLQKQKQAKQSSGSCRRSVLVISKEWKWHGEAVG